MYKTPKGCSDLVGDEYRKFQQIRTVLETAFTAEGGVPLETPVFERTDVLLGKYGEEADTKLVYNLEDQGGEALTLRYDLTVPFTRYIIENGIQKMRRWAIGKVWRRDQPSRGRWREFWQADFDILGENNTSMMAEGLLLSMAVRVLRTLGLTDIRVLVNDVRNLRSMLVDRLGVPEDKWRALCPAIDKLDKQSFDTTIPEFQAAWGDIDIEGLRAALSETNPVCAETCESWGRLQEISRAWGFNDVLTFSPSLARGLDYYSGFVWEIKAGGLASTIVAGGRYDGLLDKSLVGISFGVSRIMMLLPPVVEASASEKYMIATLGSIPFSDRLNIIRVLRDRYPSTPLLFELEEKPRKLTKVLQDADKNGCIATYIVAENEWAAQRQIIRKCLKTGTQTMEVLGETGSVYGAHNGATGPTE
jgi:histidyl-tRNA synthetase